MVYFIFKRWREVLFSVDKRNVIPQTAKVPIEFVPINSSSVDLVCELRDPAYRVQFERQLSLGDYGIYAYYNGSPVGYGWVKHTGSEDYFYTIGDNCCYLCRFFIHESMRGNGIFPATITKLINDEASINTFYIGIEKGNTASERGLRKTGFTYIDEYGFIRGFRHTFNKKVLKGKDD